MEKVVLNAEIREKLGKQASKRLRAEDAIPVVVYKKGKGTLSLKVNSRELFHILHTSAGENVIIALKVNSGNKDVKEKTVIIKEIQYGPIKADVLHVDFHEILLTEKIAVDVPIEPKGEPEGVKSDGGILDHPTKELHVECLPTQIPERIEVHVEKLKIGDAIRVKDLIVPPEVTVLSDPELTVVSVVPPRVEEVEEEVVEEGLQEPEVIGEKKPAEGEEVEEAVPEVKKEPKEKEEKKE